MEGTIYGNVFVGEDDKDVRNLLYEILRFRFPGLNITDADGASFEDVKNVIMNTTQQNKINPEKPELFFLDLHYEEGSILDLLVCLDNGGRVLVQSGDDHGLEKIEQMKRDGILSGRIGTLRKPWGVDEVSRAIKSIFNQ